MENTNEQGQQQNETEKDEKKPVHHETPHNDLTKEDIPDSTNESTGATGSGQRQDSNENHCN